MHFFEFSLFLFAVAVLFIIPGLWLINYPQKKLDLWEVLTISPILGFLSYTIASYLFHLLNLPILMLFVLVMIINSIYIFKNFKIFKTSILSMTNRKIESGFFLSLIIIAAVGIIGQLSIISPSGLKNASGDIIFYSANGHDGAWHIALANEIANKFPLKNPSMAEERLYNYHFFSDIALSDFNQKLNIESINLYFRYFPLFFSIILGLISYRVGKQIGKSKSAGLWSMMFTYFAGSFGYIVTLLKNGTIGGESLFWGSQIQSSSGNPPQIISNILFLSVIFLLIKYIDLKRIDYKIGILLILLSGFLVEFKIYAGIVLLPALGLIGIVRIIKEKKYDLFFIAFVSSIISLAIYLPNTKHTTSFLIYQPWWFIRTMIVEPGRLNWLDLELRRQTYLSENNIKRVLSIEIIGLLIFILGNLGVRIVGIYYFIEGNFKKLVYDYIALLLLTTTILGFAFPLLFLQKGVAGNTSQTLQYSILIMGVLSGVTMSKLLANIKNKLMRYTLAFLVLLVSVPTQIGLMYEFYSKPPLAKISNFELEALEFLKNEVEDGSVVLTPAYDQFSLHKNTNTPDIWAWFDTSYVSAFSDKNTYLSDFEQMDILGYDIKDRLEFQKLFFDRDIQNPKQELQKRKIDLIYFPIELTPKTIPLEKYFLKIFDNKKVQIWKTI